MNNTWLNCIYPIKLRWQCINRATLAQSLHWLSAIAGLPCWRFLLSDMSHVSTGRSTPCDSITSMISHPSYRYRRGAMIVDDEPSAREHRTHRPRVEDSSTETSRREEQQLHAHCCHMGTIIKHPAPDRAQGWAPECPDVKNYKWRV